MRISILCTDSEHPVFKRLLSWKDAMVMAGHTVQLVSHRNSLEGGDVLFLVSCSQIVSKESRDKYKANLILHASDLPKGRGWSPHIWSIIDGAKKITVSLLEAEDKVDTGDVWLKDTFELEGHELLSEINEKLFHTELKLMSHAVENFSAIKPKPQNGGGEVYMSKRTPQDSQLDPNKTLAEQFNLLRVVDNQRYPAFLEFMGERYLIKIQKDENE